MEKAIEKIAAEIKGRLGSIEILAWGHLYDWSQKDKMVSEHLDCIMKAIKPLILSLSPQDNTKLREKMADQEHRQWACWALTLMDREQLSQDRIDRWSTLAYKPYSALTEEEKDQDRYWADQSLSLLPSCDACADGFISTHEKATSTLMARIGEAKREERERIVGEMELPLLSPEAVETIYFECGELYTPALHYLTERLLQAQRHLIAEEWKKTNGA